MSPIAGCLQHMHHFIRFLYESPLYLGKTSSATQLIIRFEFYTKSWVREGWFSEVSPSLAIHSYLTTLFWFLDWNLRYLQKVSFPTRSTSRLELCNQKTGFEKVLLRRLLLMVAILLLLPRDELNCVSKTSCLPVTLFISTRDKRWIKTIQ